VRLALAKQSVRFQPGTVKSPIFCRCSVSEPFGTFVIDGMARAFVQTTAD